MRQPELKQQQQHIEHDAIYSKIIGKLFYIKSDTLEDSAFSL